jgi:isopentenyl diphosphate isomerase/L-lactate dehydrogenase-like FMN-dependent dehydrogenase
MASGVDDDATVRANREGYQHVQLRPRRLRDATKIDMRAELFGTVYDSPIFLCPTSGGCITRCKDGGQEKIGKERGCRKCRHRRKL